jgi:hypothetical protein
MARKHLIAVLIAAAILAAGVFVWSRSAAAQPYGPGMMRGGGPGMMGGGWGPGYMMGPGMMNGRYGRICGPGAAGFAQWRIERLEALIQPTDAQKAKLDELKAASAKAVEIVSKACPADFPETVPARMQLMETRMESMLQSVKIMRPAMDAFYASLTDEQKRKLDNNSGPGRFWRYRDGW